MLPKKNSPHLLIDNRRRPVNSSDLEEEWFVWSVRSDKFEIVKCYIEDKIPEVVKVLYPTVTSERVTKKGIKKSKTPLYAGYIFLQYIHNIDNPVTWNKLNNHPFITRYVGPCTAHDLASVDSLQKVEKLNNEEVRNFVVGDKIRVNGGIFVGYLGYVSQLTSNSIRVDLERSGKSLGVTFSPEDLDIVKRGAANERG